MQKRDDLIYNRETIMKLKPSTIPDRPPCCTPYENVWVTEDNGSRVKMPYNEYFKRQVGYGFFKPEFKPVVDTRDGGSSPNRASSGGDAGGRKSVGERSQQQNSPGGNDNEDWKRGSYDAANTGSNPFRKTTEKIRSSRRPRDLRSLPRTLLARWRKMLQRY